jgi:predicted Fe-S protein YdhL (DUF1289 family)
MLDQRSFAELPSPCIGICEIDDKYGLCRGCARTRSEIAGWTSFSPEAREKVWAALPSRRTALGLGVHRLGWTCEAIRAFLLETLQAGAGTWVGGVYGAVAEFCVGAGESVDVAAEGNTISAVTDRAAIRFDLSDHVRALAVGNNGVVVLALPREYAPSPGPVGLVALGPDRGAIRREDREDRLYDFGLGIGFSTFAIRTSEQTLISVMDAAADLPWPALLTAAGRQIVEASPARVVLHAIGRIEIYTAIPLPGGQTSPGPHTHLLPALLTTGREMPPGLELPDAYAPCAIFYPATSRIPEDPH